MNGNVITVGGLMAALTKYAMESDRALMSKPVIGITSDVLARNAGEISICFGYGGGPDIVINSDGKLVRFLDEL